jgi:hypothetical protein
MGAQLSHQATDYVANLLAVENLIQHARTVKMTLDEKEQAEER